MRIQLPTHRNVIYDYSNRSVELKRIDCQLVKEYKTEVQYWRNILKRTIAVIQFSQLRTREMAIMIVTWNCILQRINLTSKTIQSSTTNISIIVPLYNSLFDFIQNVRENFEIYENESYLIVDKQIDYKCKRIKKNVKERQQSLRQNFITDIHYLICNILLAEKQKKREVYVNVEKNLDFYLKKTYSEIK
jgi:hypothetical protein